MKWKSVVHSASFIAVAETRRIGSALSNLPEPPVPAYPNRPNRPIRLYRFLLSGHCHRVELFLSLLGLPWEPVEVNLGAGEQNTPEFLALNAFGQVPVIDDDGTVVADSNAILVYLTLKYGDSRWLPQDPAGAAAVQRWLSAAAGMLAFGPAAARVAVALRRQPADPAALARADRLLGIMERELGGRQWLAADRPTLADIAMYTYVAHAPEGTVSLEPYPAVRAWLGRVEALPGFVAMPKAPA